MMRLALLLLVALAALPARAAEPVLVEGLAVRMDTGEPVYREVHRIDVLSHRIDYLAVDGTPIGENTLDYACSDSAPAFEQIDRRAGSREGGRWQDGQYRLERGRADGSRSREHALPAPAPDAPPLVASSGFDRFLRAHRGQLEAGQTLAFRFAMPARLAELTLRARRDLSTEEALEWFVIEPEQALLRAFVAPIRVAYDADGRLAVYRGLSNLADADGGALQVEIRYRYGDGSRQELAIAEPQAPPARIPPRSQCSVENT